MTFTFTGRPDTQLDRIRSIVGDVDTERPGLQDEKVLAIVGAVGKTVWLRRIAVTEFSPGGSQRAELTDPSRLG